MLRERDRQPDVTACRACGKPSECEVWELPVCYGCYADWHTEAAARFTHGDKPTPPETYAAFAREWVKARASRKVVPMKPQPRGEA